MKHCLFNLKYLRRKNTIMAQTLFDKDQVYFTILRTLSKGFDDTLKKYAQETGPLLPYADDVLFGGRFKRGSAETEEKFCMQYSMKYFTIHVLEFLQEGTFSSFLF